MDIVKRLRAWRGGKWPKNQCIDDDMAEAADEIDRLRALVSNNRWCRSCGVYHDPEAGEVCALLPQKEST